MKPQAWKNLSAHALRRTVFRYTRSTVGAFVEQGTPPLAVQVGNEVSNGFLWEEPGQPCKQGGKLGLDCSADIFNDSTAFDAFGKLFDAGARGVRAACATCLVAVHTDLGNRIAELGIAHLIDWHLNLQRKSSVEFDLVGLSLYARFLSARPGRTASVLENIRQLGHLARKLPGKRIYLAETAYPAGGAVKPCDRFPPTPQGQLDYLRAVIEALAAAIPEAQRGGVLWWERNETGIESLFDQNYVARPALLYGFKHGRKSRWGTRGAASERGRKSRARAAGAL